MTPFETYVKYLAIKSHFNQETYDYIKYNGKVKADVSSFENRRDKYIFYKLAKRDDIENYLIANIFEKPDSWVGDLISDKNDEIYKSFLKRKLSLSYVFKSDLAQLNTDFDKNLIIKDGQWPSLFKLYKTKMISPETVIILNEICNFFPYWDKKITDRVIWPNMFMRLKKLRPFINFDVKYFREIVKESF